MPRPKIIVRCQIAPTFPVERWRFSAIREAVQFATSCVSYEHDWAEVRRNGRFLYPRTAIQRIADEENRRLGMRTTTFLIVETAPLQFAIVEIKRN